MDTNQSGIYAIRAPSGKLYIGSAVNLRRRWNGHRTRLQRGTHHCPGLQAACIKYGIDRLRFEILEVVPIESLIVAEQTFMDTFRGALYNASPTAGSRLGAPQSEATRAKIRAGQIGRKRSDATRARMSAAQLGRQVSAETRVKIGLTSRGREQSEATRSKRAQKLTGRVHKDNSTGYAGVGPFRGRYRARWAHKHLGLFDTPEAAYAAVCAARSGP